MVRVISRAPLRAGVAANHAGLMAATVLFLVGEYRGWTIPLLAACLAGLALVLVTFVTTYGRTGLWRLVHTPVDCLDEREVQLTHEALRRSYQVLAALALVVFVPLFFMIRFSMDLLTFRGHFSLGLALAIVMLYVVQTLPASIIAAQQRYQPLE